MDLSFLNKEQYKAVVSPTMRKAIIAGAGAGKTRSAVSIIAKLVDEGVAPYSIISTAFTNKSADEMQERVCDTIGVDGQAVRMGTFHSICNSLYREVMNRYKGVYTRPKLVTNLERWNTISNLVKKYNLPNKDVKFWLNEISIWKNSFKQVNEFRKPVEHLIESIPYQETPNMDLARYIIYHGYQKYLIDKKKMDYDDMLFNMATILCDDKYAEHIESIRHRISYILVDEAQDTNMIQFLILSKLMGDDKNVYLFADDFQAIYGFRGSSVALFKAFLHQNEFELFPVTTNYRSTKKIVDYGNTLIKKNKNQIQKTLGTNNIEGDTALILTSTSEDHEAEKISDEIESLVEQGFKFSDIAIVYRVNAQSRALVDEFVFRGIPHKVHAKFGFYDRKEIKDILSYVRVFVDPYNSDFDDFKRIINRPTRYISNDSLNIVKKQYYKKDYDSFYEALQKSYMYGLKPQQLSAITSFLNDIDYYNSKIHSEGLSAAQIIFMIINQVGYEKYLKINDGDEKEGDDDKIMNLDALYDGAARYKNAEMYLDYVDSLKDIEEQDDDRVQLMTVHKSKGLEFPVVIVAGFSTKIFPHDRSVNDAIDGIEDERRVAYVAVTRPKEKLILSCIKGSFGRLNVIPSPFLREMGLRDEKALTSGRQQLAVPGLPHKQSD